MVDDAYAHGRVFEDFGTTALKEALAGRPGATHGQYPTTLDEARRAKMRPDVVHTVNGVRASSWTRGARCRRRS